MDALDLVSVARALVPPGKGILATDEGWPAITKRFSALGIENVREQRRLAGQQAIPDSASRNGAALDGRSTPELERAVT